MPHPMMPEADHDERSEQLFVRDFKSYIVSEIEPEVSRLTSALDQQRGLGGDIDRLRDDLFDYRSFRAWISLKRTSQEIMWDVVGASVDRQLDTLSQKAAIANPKGSLTLNPRFEAPDYITSKDIHLMPGGYTADDGDVRQGAIMDRGGLVYMLGRNGGQAGPNLNDARGKAVVAHLMALYPDFHPQRVLELGCGVGASATAIAAYFPEAEIYGVDVGASMLRYAHARAEHMGIGIHYSQQSAEQTDFADESFDLVFTAALFHETSAPAIPKILREIERILKPGGVMVHLEVPNRYDQLSLWQKMSTEYETHFNNEPCWRVATSADYDALCRGAGFDHVAVGYQQSVSDPTSGQSSFSPTKPATQGSWYMVSGRKNATDEGKTIEGLHEPSGPMDQATTR